MGASGSWLVDKHCGTRRFVLPSAGEMVGVLPIRSMERRRRGTTVLPCTTRHLLRGVRRAYLRVLRVSPAGPRLSRHPACADEDLAGVDENGNEEDDDNDWNGTGRSQPASHASHLDCIATHRGNRI